MIPSTRWNDRPRAVFSLVFLFAAQSFVLSIHSFFACPCSVTPLSLHLQCISCSPTTLCLSRHLSLAVPSSATFSHSTSHLSASFWGWPSPLDYQSSSSSAPGRPCFLSPFSNRREGWMRSERWSPVSPWELLEGERSQMWQTTTFGINGVQSVLSVSVRGLTKLSRSGKSQTRSNVWTSAWKPAQRTWIPYIL